MRHRLLVDPEVCDYGDRTESVRRVLYRWRDTEFFLPPEAGSSEAAERALRTCSAVSYDYMPDAFARDIHITPQEGSYAQFVELYGLTRGFGEEAMPKLYDWKFDALKKLRHLMCGEKSKVVEKVPFLKPPDRTWQELGILRALSDHPGWSETIEAASLQAGSERAMRTEQALSWYYSYAERDLLNACVWSAFHDGDLAQNPFWHLLECYALRYYPFNMSRDAFVLFSFTS